MESEKGKIFPLHLDRKPADSSLSHLLIVVNEMASVRPVLAI
jgi:hypothetical protein